MRLRLVRDLVAHASNEAKPTTVRELRFELAGNAQQDVPLLAPVIGPIAGGVFHHADTN